MKKYKIIYADPPWNYRVWSKKGDGRSARNHYETMNTEEICNLPIKNIADKDSVLFLWVTFPCLLDGLKTMIRGGFKYKTCGFTWVKKNKKGIGWFFGLGYWTRANAELCLIGTRGKISRKSNRISQVIDTPIEEHSKKPNIVREKIVELMGDLPRIELFARQKVNGWDVWGNEIESDINMSDYEGGKDVG